MEPSWPRDQPSGFSRCICSPYKLTTTELKSSSGNRSSCTGCIFSMKMDNDGKYMKSEHERHLLSQDTLKPNSLTLGPFSWRSVWQGAFQEEVQGRPYSSCLRPVFQTPQDSSANNETVGNGICHRHDRAKNKWCGTCCTEMCLICSIDMNHDRSHKVFPIGTVLELANQKIMVAREDLTDVSLHLTSLALRLKPVQHQEAIDFFLCLRYNLEQTNKCLTVELRPFCPSVNDQRASRVRNLPEELRYQNTKLDFLSSDEILPMVCKINEQLLGPENPLLKDYIQIRYWLEIMAVQLEVDEPGRAPNTVLALCSVALAKLFAVYRDNLKNASNEKAARESQNEGHFKNMHKRTISGSSDSEAGSISSGIGESEYSGVHGNGPNYNRVSQARPNVFFLDFETDQNRFGKVLIETNPDAAPLMSANFAVLCTGARGHSFEGCVVFQCWNKESIIAGDYENNDGTGGKSILNGEYFDPDETHLPPERGAVGMRRFKQRLHKRGKVSSQFRIMLKHKKGISAIFGHVIQGIEIIDAIAALGDEAGVPAQTVTVVSCGKYAPF